MMARICTSPGCGALVERGRCAEHQRSADLYRGTAHERGYTTTGHRAFRAAVLRRNPICVVCEIAVSTVADHHPRERATLAALGLDPNDPTYGRGLCASCHGKETALNQPGGWNRR